MSDSSNTATTLNTTNIALWNKLSTRLSLLIVVIVLVLAAATAYLLWRGFDLAQQDAVAQLAAQGIEANSDVPTFVRSTIFNLAAIFLLTLVLATVFSRNLLTEPINQLAEATREVASGRLGITLPVRSRDEIGVLAESFNQMSMNLASRTEELVAANRALKESESKLEQRVQQRTQELMALLELSNSIALTTEDMPLVESVFDELHDITGYQSASLFELLGNSFEVFLTRGSLSRVDEAQMLESLNRRQVVSVVTEVGEATIFPIRVRDKAVGVLVLEHDQAHDLSEEKERLVRAFASQAGIAIENVRLYADVTEKAAFEERQHLARELHDSVSQALYSIVLGSHAARKQLNSDPEQAGVALEYVQNLAEAGLAEMRALIFELRPEVLEQEGLSAALAKQLEALEIRHGLKTEFVMGDEPDLPFGTKQALFRVVQEALHNVVKHAHATTASLRLEQTADSVLLEIKDNGVGFDTEQLFSGRLGLKSMRERAVSLGGTFELNSRPGAGTLMRIVVPLTQVSALDNKSLDTKPRDTKSRRVAGDAL